MGITEAHLDMILPPRYVGFQLTSVPEKLREAEPPKYDVLSTGVVMKQVVSFWLDHACDRYLDVRVRLESVPIGREARNGDWLRTSSDGACPHFSAPPENGDRHLEDSEPVPVFRLRSTSGTDSYLSLATGSLSLRVPSRRVWRNGVRSRLQAHGNSPQP